MSSSLLDVLGRVDGESDKALMALVNYAAMGPGRSLAKVATSGNEWQWNLRSLGRWSSRYKWVERVAAWDRVVLEQQAEEWARRQEALREADYLDGKMLREKGRERFEVLALADISAGQAMLLVKQGSELQRLAAGMITSNQRVEAAGFDEFVRKVYGNDAGDNDT